MIFTTNQLFKSISDDSETGRWNFVFENDICISTSGLWRLLQENKIKGVSLDNGHQFWLSEPLNLVEKVTQQLLGKTLTKIVVNPNTADLTLVISDNISIEIFIVSTGYETYEFTIDNERYIGLGSWEIGIVEATDNPYILTTRQL